MTAEAFILNCKWELSRERTQRVLYEHFQTSVFKITCAMLVFKAKTGTFTVAWTAQVEIKDKSCPRGVYKVTL